MPYIRPKERIPIDLAVNRLVSVLHKKGEANYAITRLLCLLVREDSSYTELSNARSVLLDVYDEFTRKVLYPYEDKMEGMNGPVHHLKSRTLPSEEETLP